MHAIEIRFTVHGTESTSTFSDIEQFGVWANGMAHVTTKEGLDIYYAPGTWHTVTETHGEQPIR